MTDMRSEALMDEQLDLITQYLNSQLDAKRADEVRRRLEQDREFLQLAAPLILAWEAMRQGRPVRASESEKRWDDFTRKADFVHHRKRRIRRNWWIIGIVAGAIILPATYYLAQPKRMAVSHVSTRPIPPDSAWIAYGKGVEVRLVQGAVLKSSTTADGVELTLRGMARVRVSFDTLAPNAKTTRVRLITPAWEIQTFEGEFTVEVNGDTAKVQVYEPSQKRYVGGRRLPTVVQVRTFWTRNPDNEPELVGENFTALLRPSRPPLVFPPRARKDSAVTPSTTKAVTP